MANTARKKLTDLRSQRWFAADDIRAFAHRQRAQQMGLRREEFMGKPVIAILNTWSDLSPCHAHLRDRAEAVKRGVWQAGGFPVELPVLSVGEVMVKPTTMLYRNFLAMQVEEILRSHPVDGVVMLGGCDKSTPGLLMGAISMNLPAIFCPAGPMSNGKWRGTKTGAGTHTKIYWNKLQTGEISQDDWVDLESRMTRSAGTCNTMGTASTMTSIVDAMGMTLTGASSVPASDSGHPRMASACGERAVQMVWEDLKPSDIVTAEAVDNGLATYMALGGSTNAAIHLIAMARRAGIDLTLEHIAGWSDRLPVLVNLFPSGNALMEDFHFAGGLPALLWKMRDHLDLSQRTVEGRSLGQAIEDAPCYDDDIIRGPESPVLPLDQGRTLVLLKGNLAPDGAVMKTSASEVHLQKHRGPALVFDGPKDMFAQINDPDLDVTPDTVLVLRGAGPIGAPGMPEWGNLPIPRKLLKQGVTDMVRISDGRMSGTHAGTCVLHVAPESAVGGPLALLRTGDMVELDVAAGALNVDLSEAELASRRAVWTAPVSPYTRSFAALYQGHVTQAPQGCDFDFLEGTDPVPEPPIF